MEENNQKPQGGKMPQGADGQEVKYQRRPRYKGTHPRKFEEKYKELHPEKYGETVEKVMKKGSTPAGMHRPICVNEILEFLQVTPGQTGFDATLGYGGHSGEILKCLAGQGHLYSFDVDPIESEKTEKRLRSLGYGEDVWSLKLTNFANIGQVAQETGPVDFVLADLGVSSMQIDNPQRGFSYKTEGPLDLRLDPTSGVSAAQRLRELDAEDLEYIFVENADEPYAREIARDIIRAIRKGQAMDTTSELRAVIEAVVAKKEKEITKEIRGTKEKEEAMKEAMRKSCQRCFQALRIDVNSEFEVLEAFLQALPTVLKPGGRAAILTFHSGEDRLVKQYFKLYKKDGIFADVARDVIRPSAQECISNPRARSTKMRWAIKA